MLNNIDTILNEFVCMCVCVLHIFSRLSLNFVCVSRVGSTMCDAYILV